MTTGKKMGKQNRQRRRQVDGIRRSAGQSAAVADRAEAGLASMVEGIVNVACAQGQRVRHIHLDGFERLRAGFIDKGFRWPSWSYLPLALVGAGLGEGVALDLNPSFISPATILASLVAAWLPGRIAVRFDDDLAAALIATPLEATIPAEVLRRLPTWGLYIDAPHLGPDSGFFVALDPGRLEAPGRSPSSDPDELLVVVIKSDSEQGLRHLMSTVWLLPGASIAESLAAQARQRAVYGSGALESDEDVWAEAMGMPRSDALARILSLVLYLCSTDADTTQKVIPPPSARRGASRAVTVVSAGFRIGAALRGGPRSSGPQTAGSTERRVAPHLRRAHWHSYWCGSEVRGDRRLELRWVPPVSVNAEMASELLTVVRAAGRAEPT